MLILKYMGTEIAAFTALSAIKLMNFSTIITSNTCKANRLKFVQVLDERGLNKVINIIRAKEIEANKGYSRNKVLTVFIVQTTLLGSGSERPKEKHFGGLH